MATFDYAKYLAAKELIDLRSINPGVWQTFVDAMRERAGRQVKILEVGGGIGTMLKRLSSLGLDKDIAYTLLEIETENVAYFQSHVGEWLSKVGYHLRHDHQGKGNDVIKEQWVNEAGQAISIEVIHRDIEDVISAGKHDGKWDVLIAQAFLDLFDLETFLPRLLRLLTADGLFYFPINFDGITSFLPTYDPDLDALVERIYHDSMDARAKRPVFKGRSKSGRHLLTQLSFLPVSLLGVGGSDWLIYPRGGKYAADERYFLSQILGFVEGELEKSNAISSELADQWIQKRRQELAAGILIYMAHQIDVSGVKKQS